MKLTDLTIPVLTNMVKRNEATVEKLQRYNERLERALEKKLMARYSVKKGDYIVGKAVVFNKKRSIVAQVERVYKTTDWQSGKQIVEVVSYTAGDKQYTFNMNEIRKAKPSEINKFKEKKTKWERR